MKFIIFFTLSLCSFEAFSQSKDSIQFKGSIFINPETPPSFPGGIDSLEMFTAKNLRYPYKRLDVEGRVYVQFTVNNDGSLSDAKVIKGLCEPCDKNALELFSIMPKWIPGRMYDKPVKMQMIYPVKFKLD
jgi:protein TonB